jgi:hypothetical protein
MTVLLGALSTVSWRVLRDSREGRRGLPLLAAGNVIREIIDRLSIDDDTLRAGVTYVFDTPDAAVSLMLS